LSYASSVPSSALILPTTSIQAPEASKPSISRFRSLTSSNLEMRLRLRAKSGNHLVTLDDTATVGDLFAQISQLTGYLMYDLKCGFPPRVLELNAYPMQMQLQETGVSFNNEQIIVEPRELEDMGVLTIDGKTGGPLSHGLTVEEGQKKLADQKLQQKSGASQSRSGQKSNFATLSSLSSSANEKTTASDDKDEASVPLRKGRMIQRVMPDDNSCLFRALGTAILGNALDSAIELRSIVTSAIIAQPDVYSEAVLQKSPKAYCEWIMRENSWGGYIESKAIAEHFGIEVVTLDVSTGLPTVFNEGASRRCFIVYSGIHYDVLAYEPTSGYIEGGGETDQYQFDTMDKEALQAAEEVTKILKKQNYYTDTAKFGVKCNVCGWKGEGEKAATAHASQTGHMDFEEA
jgi:ubiquitin thioesterase OTU1